MTEPSPTPSSGHKPSLKGMGNAIKNPRVAIAVAVLAVGFVWYFRHRSNSSALPVTDNAGTAVTDPTTNTDYYPGDTQGAGGSGSGGSGDYGGYPTPDMNLPDWLTNPPVWFTDAPSWYTNPPVEGGNEPAATNPANPVTVVKKGQGVYDPATHGFYTFPTGGGPPNPPNHKTPPKAKPPAHVQTNHAGNANQAKRFVVKVEKVGSGKNAKSHKFHLYESAHGKADWGNGGRVDMGPA